MFPKADPGILQNIRWGALQNKYGRKELHLRYGRVFETASGYKSKWK